MKNVISLVLISILIATSAYSQKIYFSGKEPENYGMVGTHIIGKVKDNIIAFKFSVLRQKMEFVVFDDQMRLKKHVNFDNFPLSTLLRLDFVSRGDVFDVVTQRFSDKTYYCQVLRFNEEGELQQPVRTIDSVPHLTSPDDAVFCLVESENKKHLILTRDVGSIASGRLALDFFYLKEDLTVTGRKVYAIPYNEAFVLSDFAVDNEGSLLFAEFLPDFVNQNTITLYKIDSADSAVNSVRFVRKYFPENICIAIDNDNKKYLLTGIVSNDVLAKDYSTSRETAKLFVCSFDSDLSTKANDTIIETGIRSVENSTVSFNTLVADKRRGYYVSWMAVRKARLSLSLASGYTSDFSTFDPGGSYSGFYRQPDLSNSPQVPQGSYNQPSNPIYYGASNRGDELSNYREQTGAFQRQRIQPSEPVHPHIKLFIARVDDTDKIQWSKFLDKNAETDNLGDTEINNWASSNNLHFTFSSAITKKNREIRDLIVNEAGNTDIRPVVVSDLQYNIDIKKGLQIGANSFVFPCRAGDRLAFAKIEFD